MLKKSVSNPRLIELGNRLADIEKELCDARDSITLYRQLRENILYEIGLINNVHRK